MKSILQKDKVCYFTGSTNNLHEHRKLSEKYGLKIWLREDFHTGNQGIHHNKEMALTIKQEAQKAAMEYYGWNIKKFIEIFGRNYL